MSPDARSIPHRFLTSCRLPLYDFLIPNHAQKVHRIRSISTARKLSTTIPTSRSSLKIGADHVTQTAPNHRLKSDPTIATKPASSKPLSQAQRDFLTRALRVNQAGELAATRIYAAQTPPVVASHPHLRPLMKHMYDQEAGHFETFNALLAKHRIRPTAMYPVWTIASSALGWATAVMGREAAMACTEAVETEIGDHYNGQVRVLLNMVTEMEANDEEIGEELKDLISTIRRIRDEELEHLDHAVENDAQEAVPYALLTGVIRAGCRGAIWISERV